MEPALQLRNVSKQIGKKNIVRDITFNIYPGEIFGLLGPNGAGKTTVIRMIVGLIGITQGEIIIQGHHLAREFTKAIGYLGAIVETPEFYSFLTGYQNLTHFARLSNRIPPGRIEEIVELFQMKDYIHNRVGTYSLGMKQRLGVAQALLHRPSVLILDEPTNGLDPIGIRELRKTLRYLARQERVSVMVSSHLLGEMELMCDRVGILKQGKMLEIRTLGAVNDQTRVFRVNNNLNARTVLQQFFPQIPAWFSEEYIKVKADAKTTALINARFVGAGLEVYSIEVDNPTLEDLFMEVTQDEPSAPIDLE